MLPSKQTGRDGRQLVPTEPAACSLGKTPKQFRDWARRRTLRCWTELRRPLRAVPVLEAALARYDDAHARDKSLYLSWLADSYLTAGEVEQAATVTGHAVALASEVASVRPRERLGCRTSQRAAADGGPLNVRGVPCVRPHATVRGGCRAGRAAAPPQMLL
ncbi:XRE family transcriptional regulator [Streptomyces zinciresistens K42]|uniref:XRE family transcriptional regulator n=1 Tax=Streptomyces zinciresistens K42 TaxID=700597 RepID=G2GMD3_9ACTN|nr:hypothetical protein [Streptomyces zinciresistens]EGX55319.1 XRE family transcriptional regulator [Streptomyces zinciresistens K42]